METVFHVMVRQANAPLLVAASAVYLIAFLVTRRLQTRHAEALGRINGAERAWQCAAAVTAVAYLGVYSYLSVHRYHKLMSGAWDLGIFDSLFQNALRGRFFRDYRGPFDHFQPIYLALVPIYAIWQDPRCLLILQTVVLAAAAWPLYRLAVEVSGDKALGAAVAILYLLYPLVGEANLYDVHMLSFSPVCFFSMLFFMVRKRWRWYWVFLVLTLCAKESECIIVFGAGLYLISRSEYLRGALTSAVAVAWFFGMTLWVLPAITGVPFRHFWRFAGLDASVQWAYQTRLGQLTAAAYAVRVAAVCLFTLVPASFIVARTWRTFFLMFVPVFAINMVVKSEFQNNLFGHYGITVSSVVFGGGALALAGAGNSLKGKKPSRLPLFVTIVGALLNVALSYPANERFLFYKAHIQAGKTLNVMSLPVPYSRERLDFYRAVPREKLFFAVRDAIPPGTSVVAQNNLACYFVNRNRVQAPCLDRDWYQPADYYLFDMKETYGALRPGDWETLYRSLVADPSYVPLIYLHTEQSPGFIFFARREKAVEVYNNLLAALKRDPADEGALLAVHAMEQVARRPP